MDTVIAETPASAQAGDPVAEAERAAETLKQAKLEIAKKIVGQDEVVDLTLAAILSGGHALLVGVPGLAKTLLVDTLGTVMGLNSNRIQFCLLYTSPSPRDRG